MNATPESLPQVEVGDDKLDHEEEAKRAMADLKWMRQQHRLGKFDEYWGEYVGVFEQKVVGHGKRLRELREMVEREQGIPASRLLTTYVGDPKNFVGGRRWLA